MDVHKDAMAVAYGAKAPDAEVVSRGTIGTRQAASAHLVRQRQSQATQLVCVYEAGPRGDWRYRSLLHKGHHGWVVAPSWIATKAGARVPTERRDAGPLARLMRSGALPPVDVPQVPAEALRDLTRAREDAIGDLKTAECRLQAFRLRHHSRYTGRAAWGPAHLRGLSEGVCPTPAQPLVVQEYGRAVTEHTERLPRLAQARHDHVHPWRLPPVVEALPALRGAQCTVAVPLVAELGALTRLDNPRPLLHYLGLIPSDDSRGERRRQGTIPKAGTTHARRALVESAWAFR